MKNKLTKYLLILLIITQFMLFNIIPVKATTYGRIAATDGLRLRSGPGTSKYSKLITVPHNTIVTIVEQNIPTDDNSTGCTTGLWHKLEYNNQTGYACSRYIEIQETTDKDENGIPESDMSKMTDEEFETYLTNQGFPESYKIKLRELHKLHPNWVFVGIKGRANWSTILKQENYSGRNVYQSTSSSTQGYLSTEEGYYDWYTDKFDAKEGSTWYQASSETISYYLDPRNFLTEDGIFMFEDLNYYSSYQTADAVKAILYTEFYNDLVPYYIEAATKFNVSPIYLAALSRQEVGLKAGYATSGNGGSYCGSTTLNGFYNFYNIGANSGVCDGIKYAAKESVNWNTKQKAIVNGAEWIVSGYIDAGQNTPYFQKFNTSINATTGYWHQYMGNVRAVASSAKTTKTSYKSMGIIDYPIVFQIPIYDGIPEKTELPKTGNPNNWLKTLTVNNASVTNFDSEITKYTVNVTEDTKEVTIGATTINANAKTNGTGKITLTGTTTTINIIVTAQNGNTRTYTIDIIKPNSSSNDNQENNNEEIIPPVEEDKEQDKEEEKPNEPVIIYPTPEETIINSGYKITSDKYMTNFTLGSTVQGTIEKLQKANKYASINITNNSNKPKTSGSLVTGDQITIISNDNTKTYTVVIYGDNNGDGEITILDLANVQKHLLKKSTLNGVYAKATDTNKDGQISILDLANVQKHLLKKNNISQS